MDHGVPFARDGDPLTSLNGCGMAHHGYDITMHARLGPQSAKAILLVIVGDALVKPARSSCGGSQAGEPFRPIRRLTSRVSGAYLHTLIWRGRPVSNRHGATPLRPQASQEYDAATKLLYLVLNHAAAAWKRPPREWAEAKTQFAVMFTFRTLHPSRFVLSAGTLRCLGSSQ